MKGLHQVLPMIALFANLAIGTYVITRDPRSTVNRLFLALACSLAMWSLGEFIMQVATQASTVLVGARIASIGWCMLGPVFVHFCLATTGYFRGKRRVPILALLYGSGVALVSITWFTDLVFEGFRLEGPYWHEVAGPLRIASEIYLVVLMVTGLWLLFHLWRTTPVVARRTQVAYLLVAAVIPFAVGLVSDFILPLFDRYLPFSSATVTPIMAAVIAYAVTRHQLMTTVATTFGDAIVANISDSVLVTDPGGLIDSANPAALALTGYSIEELTGLPVDRLLIRPEPEEEEAGAPGRVPAERPSFCMARSGEVIPVAVGEAVISRGPKRKVGTVYVLHDIRETLRRASAEQEARLSAVKARAAHERLNALTRAQDELHAEKLFLEGIIDNIMEPLFIKDRRRRFIIANKAYTSLLNIDRDVLLGHTNEELFPPESAETITESDDRVFDGGELVELELESDRVPGETVHSFKVLKAPIRNERGEVEYLVGIVNAVTQQKELDRLRLDFIRTAAHELRTPLTSLKLGFDLLARETDGRLDEDQKRSLEVLSLSIKRMAQLGKDLLDLANMDAGLVAMDVKPVDPARLLQETIALYESQAKEKGLACELDLDGCPEKVMVDPNRFAQVMHNLMSNAVKFTEEGGITVSVRRAGRGFMEVRVSDTGIGIPEVFHDQVFSRFAKAKPAQTAGRGSGLGLAIAKSIVDTLGGSIGMESEVGKGSSFYFTVPIE